MQKGRYIFYLHFLSFDAFFLTQCLSVVDFQRTYFTQRCSKQFVKHHHILKINDTNFSILLCNIGSEKTKGPVLANIKTQIQGV